MREYAKPALTRLGTLEALTQKGPPAGVNPPGKLETGYDAFTQRSRIESLDGPAWTEFR